MEISLDKKYVWGLGNLSNHELLPILYWLNQNKNEEQTALTVKLIKNLIKTWKVIYFDDKTQMWGFGSEQFYEGKEIKDAKELFKKRIVINEFKTTFSRVSYEPRMRPNSFVHVTDTDLLLHKCYCGCGKTFSMKYEKEMIESEKPLTINWIFKRFDCGIEYSVENNIVTIYELVGTPFNNISAVTNRQSGKTTRVIDEAVQKLFSHGKIYVQDVVSKFDEKKPDTTGLVILDPDFRVDVAQQEMKKLLLKRLSSEHKGRYIIDGNWIIVKND